jgi:transcriptional regulator with XRE-family HTH domain
MISNERQYRITKSRAEEFERALGELTTRQANADPLWRNVQRDAVTSQLDDLREELRLYETLRKRGPEAVEVTSFEDLPRALIMARIAAGLTQKELGNLLALKEQQIQRYEATGYASASLQRIRSVVEALGLRLGRGIFFPKKEISMERLLQRTDQLGIPRDFLSRRIFPAETVGKKPSAFSENEQNSLALHTAARIERVFQVPSSLLFSNSHISIPAGVLGQARFKIPARADKTKVSAFAVYAHYLGLLLLECTQHLKVRPIPADPKQIYEEIFKSYGDLSLESCLKYVWSLGIPVLPLRDKGGFHGACWRVKGRSVIVLKQVTQSSGRWIIDLFHEVKHLGQAPPDLDLAWIEEFDKTGRSDDSDEEEEATDFAVDVALGGNAEDLAQQCARECKQRMPLLKTVVQKVAERHKVRADVLANYMAYRLEEEGQDWWGTAQNLQEVGPDPWKTAKEILVAHVDGAALNPIDLGLLMQALAEGV